jgi:hypothetical protein
MQFFGNDYYCEPDGGAGKPGRGDGRWLQPCFGELVACNVHVAPSLGNAMGSLYNAGFTGTPMIFVLYRSSLTAIAPDDCNWSSRAAIP